MIFSDRHKIFTYENVEILEVNCSSVDVECFEKLIDIVLDYFSKKQPQEAFLLLNIEKLSMDKSMLNISKRALISTEFQKATVAYYNVNSLRATIIKSITLFSKKRRTPFRTREEALAYLISVAR